MAREQFDEESAEEFVKDIKKRPNADHPIDQILLVGDKLTRAQQSAARGQPMIIIYDNTSIRVEKTFLKGMKTVYRALGGNGK